MPPQPLSSVKSSAVVKWGGDAFEKHPELSVLVVRCIAGWAHAEGFMRELLVRMLGARAEPAAKMYAALSSAQAQFSVLQAAARCTLRTPHLEMFEAIISLARRTARARHRLAHDLWCYSDDIPDAMLLLEATAAFNFTIEKNQFLQNGSVLAAMLQGQKAPTFPTDRVYVYREKDLAEILNEIFQVQNYLAQFQNVATPDSPTAASSYSELLLEPRIQEALARQSKKSGSDQ